MESAIFLSKKGKGKKLIRFKCITFSAKTLVAQVAVNPNQDGLDNTENALCHLI